jgi:dUTPase
MSNYIINNIYNNNNYINLGNMITNLLNIVDRVMVLKIYLDTDDEDLKGKYYMAVQSHNNKIINNPQYIDAGFDLFNPTSIHKSNINSMPHLMDYFVACSAIMYTDTNKSFNTGFYLHPRSSISKTKLRLANSTGIIDAGYRGHIMAMFDINDQVQNNYVDDAFVADRFDRNVQLCAPGLVPILVEIVESRQLLGEQTIRGNGGFGSTGV